jgi:branched-chain amino acid transport system ATP-binding protein
MRFGGLLALSEVSLAVKRGSITAIIGPNGAGKTTLFNCLTGLNNPTSGLITYRPQEGQTVNLTHGSLDKAARLGLARTFQNIRLFNELTVLENVLIGLHSRLKAGLWGALTGNKKTRAEEALALELANDLLQKQGFGDLTKVLAKNLPYGLRKRLEITRALAAQPTILLLDEPAAGLNGGEAQDLIKLIREVKSEGNLTIILIEHDMSLVMSVSDEVHALEYGRLIASGTPAAIQRDERVIKAYLGEE